jgi:peptidoglycan/LPS O-acetylase OafA/YrhL
MAADVNRSQSIDVLRAIAIILVCFGRHLKPAPGGSNQVQAAIHQSTVFFITGGWVGVDLFFVLSGFLVSGLLMREYQASHTLSPSWFLIRRGFKIYPAFWVLLSVTVLVTIATDRFTLGTFLSELFFMQNYGLSWWVHMWSLAVEEHFYLLLICVLGYVVQSGRPNPFAVIPPVFLAVAIVCFALRCVTAWNVQPFTFWTHQFPSHLRLDSLCFGVLLAYGYHFHTVRFVAFAQRYRAPLFAIGAALLLPAFLFRIQDTVWIYTIGFTVFYLGAGALLTASLVSPYPQHHAVRAAAYLGRHSYSIYLWHLAVADWLVPFVLSIAGRSWLAYVITYTVGVLVVGVGMSLAVEVPMLALRDRWFPSLARPMAQKLPSPSSISVAPGRAAAAAQP